jgi:hypothetical protein
MLISSGSTTIDLSPAPVDLQYLRISIIHLLQLTLHLDTDKAPEPLGFKQILITIYLVNAQP